MKLDLFNVEPTGSLFLFEIKLARFKILVRIGIAFFICKNSIY